jgi:hypothetical protein
MKKHFLFIVICFFSCTGNVNETDSNAGDSVGHVDPSDSVTLTKAYSNVRFKDVTVTKSGNNKFTIEGKGQIFEANFNWVVEDGHEELQKGFQMTDAGAPAWGNFKYTIEVQKKRPNSTLTLILFEASAQDGSRQHELPIVLE